ncbi:MAG: lytic transglycosylase [Desulfobacca sp.]|nr:lytic transglycosylase [Desulfobacca sp.]
MMLMKPLKAAKNGFFIFSLVFGISFLWTSPTLATYYTFPPYLTLCGEQVPLSDRRVWERMDREFMLNVYDRGQVFLWLKRSKRYFPFIEARLKEKGMPDDLKYLLVAESSLRSLALSNKGAAGFWQFIEKTGKRFSLEKKPWIDERLDLVKSTDAAINYLKILYNQFGKWTLAMAAYNCGEERVKEEISQQGENEYYRLALPQETERYIFRILAAKILLSDPKRYGFELPEKESYLPIETDLVVLQLSRSIPLRDIAKACGSYFKELKELNPELQGYTLPAGVYQLKIPFGRKPLLEKYMKEWLKPSP